MAFWITLIRGMLAVTLGVALLFVMLVAVGLALKIREFPT